MKSERQNKIIELITKNSIGTQEELAEALKQAGFSAWCRKTEWNRTKKPT